VAASAPIADRPGRAGGVPHVWKIVAAVAAIAGIGWAIQAGVTVDPDVIRGWLVDLGPVGPIAYVVLYTAQVICAPLPGLPIGAAAGFAFGLAPAMAYGMAGLGIGVVGAMCAGRHWGLRLLARVAGPDAIARWESLRLVNSPITWLLVFLGPSPDLILFVAGMSRIPLRILIPIGIVGRAPAMATATLIGAGIVDTGPWLLVGAAAVGLLFGVGPIFLRRFIPQPQPAPASPAS
jgi:uncharacterized membrane protein YdjX (TVP38/TMEM64 family)